MSNMDEFDVDFDVRLYNGSIRVKAESADSARLTVENMSLEELIEHTNDTSVEIEKVTKAT